MAEAAGAAPSRFRVLVPFGAALVAASLLASGFAVLVRLGLDLVTVLLFGADDVLSAFRGAPLWARLLAPAIGALLGGLVSWSASRLLENQGVGDVMEAVVLGRGRVSLRAALVKAVSSFFAIAGGGSLGREGPIIQVGSALAGLAARTARLSPSRTRILLAAGTAAGFAAAYNTPIAATLFVIEIVTGVVALEVVVPVVVAAAIATATSRFFMGEGPFYGLREYELVTPGQLAASVLLGPLAGLAGIAFMALLARGESVFERLGKWKPLRAALGGLIVGCIALVLPEVTGNGAEPIREMLDGRVIGIAFFALLVAKPIATTASVSSGSAGGVFTPSMFLGAALGAGIASAFYGGMGADRVPVVGAFALVGMAAVVAATTHAPLMATVLAFEMSGDYALVIPLLVTTALATGTARLLRRESIYTAEVRRKGVAWDGSIAHRLARSVRARDVLEPALVVAETTTIEDASARIRARKARVAYAAGEAGVVAIDLRALTELEPAERARTMREGGSMVAPVALDDGLPALSERLWTEEWGEVPAVDADGKIVGIVTRRGLLGALDRELLQRDLLLTRMTWSEMGAAAFVELPRGQRIAVVRASAASTGRPLDVMEARARDGVWVLAVRSDRARAPWRDSYDAGPAAEGDRWLVVGSAAAIDAMER